jgi:hypothetical protein
MGPTSSSRPFSSARARCLTFLVTFSCALAVWPNTVAAQVYSGSLTGVVTDPSGAVVPGAHVSLIDVSKGYSFSASSDSVGRYVIRNLPPSSYRLIVEAKGFESFSQAGVTPRGQPECQRRRDPSSRCGDPEGGGLSCGARAFHPGFHDRPGYQSHLHQ